MLTDDYRVFCDPMADQRAAKHSRRRVIQVSTATKVGAELFSLLGATPWEPETVEKRGREARFFSGVDSSPP